jgi:hypothetical protein
MRKRAPEKSKKPKKNIIPKAEPLIPKVVPGMKVEFWMAGDQRWRLATVFDAGFPWSPSLRTLIHGWWQGENGSRIYAIHRLEDFGKTWRLPQVEQGEPPAPKPGPSIRTFAEDWRAQPSPSLHNHRVRSAYEDLKIAQKAITQLEDCGHFSASLVATKAVVEAIRTAMQHEIERSAAFFEAAALLFAGLEPPKE